VGFVRSRNTVPIRPFLTGHTVSTAAHEGWDKLQNGDLLNAAEAAGFEVFLTTDKNIRYEQNLTAQLVVAAVNAAAPGSYIEVEIPYG
jgi:hypothetical protein